MNCFTSRVTQKIISSIGLVSIVVLASSSLSANEADAGKQKFVDFSIEPTSVAQAILQFTDQSGIQVVISTDKLRGLETSGVQGKMYPQNALAALLKDAQVDFQFVGENTVTVQAKSDDGGEAEKRTKKQEAGRSDPIIEEMLVTAQRREQRLQDVPISIAAIGADELEARQINTYEDLGQSVPGLTVTSDGLDMQITIRGVGNAAGEASTVGVYFDEAPLTPGWQAFQIDVPVYDLERVEVLRGPQGTLFGQGSMGGTIRFISKEPQLDQFGATLDVAASYTQDGAPGQKLQTMLNIPLIENELALRIAGTFDHRGGWIDQPRANQKDFNDHDLANVRAKMLWSPSNSLEISAMAIVHRSGLVPNWQEDENGNFTQAFNMTFESSVEMDYELYNLTAAYDFDTFQLLTTSSYLDQSYDSYEGFRCCGGLELISDDFLSQESFSQELRLSSQGDSALQWTVGGVYSWSEVGFGYSYWLGTPLAEGEPLPESYGPGSASADFSSHSWAVFGDISYQLTDQIELGVGARYFEDRRDIVNYGQFFLGERLTPVVSSEAKFDSFSPRIYLRYQLNDDVNFYVNMADGFRSGGFNLYVSDYPGFKPETVRSYDIGAKMSLLDGAADLDVALFYGDYRDYVLYEVDSTTVPPLAYYSNVGNMELKGIEWSLSWQVTDRFGLGINGAHIESKFVEVGQGTGVALGQRGPDTPKLQINPWVDYQFDLLGKTSTMRLDYSRRGRVYSVFAPDQPSDVIELLNFDFDWQWSERLSLGFFAKNLLNERGFLSPQELLSARPRPRTFGFEIGMEL